MQNSKGLMPLQMPAENMSFKTRSNSGLFALPQRSYVIACKANERNLHATSVEKSSIFQIRKLNVDHSCFGLQHNGNQEATYVFLAEYLGEKLKDNPRYCPVDIVSDVKRDLGMQITYSKAFCAKEAARRVERPGFGPSATTIILLVFPRRMPRSIVLQIFSTDSFRSGRMTLSAPPPIAT